MATKGGLIRYFTAILLVLLTMTFCSGTMIIQKFSSDGGCSGTYGNNDESGYSGYAVTADGYIRLTRVALSCSGNITGVYGYCENHDTTGREVILLVYSDNAGSPDDQLYEGSPYWDVGGGDPEWISDTGLSVSVSGDPTYVWVGAQFESNTNNKYWRLAGQTGQGFYSTSYAFGSAPAENISGTASDYASNFYVTF